MTPAATNQSNRPNLLSFVVPVYNEEPTLAKIVELVLALNLPFSYRKELILVNDGSKDKSWEIIQRLQKAHPQEIKAVNNPQNMGKTRTVLHGTKESTGDLVIIQDADLEYEPKEIIDLLNLLKEKHLDVVYGNRFGLKNKIVYWSNYLGNRGLSMLSNLFTYPRIHSWITDMEVCYKMVRGDVMREIAQNIVSTSSFGFEPEITAKLSKYMVKDPSDMTAKPRHLRFGQLPITYKPRTIAEGKKIKALNDGVKAIGEVIKFNLGR